jgi:small-conductance mechanosensitive channel
VFLFNSYKELNLFGENMRVHLYFSILYGRSAYQFLLSVLLLTILFFQTQSFADKNQLDSNSIYHKAPIIIDGSELFSVRGFSSFTAEERASLIKKRIEEIAADPAIPANSIQIIQNESSDDLYARGKFILSVFDTEAQSEGISRDILSFGIKNRITKAIYNYRYERKPETLLTRAFYAIGATILTLLLLLIINWTTKKVNLFLQNKIKTKLETIETKSFQLIKSNQLWLTLDSIIKGLKLIIVIILLFLLAEYVLGLYPWTRFFSISLIGFFIQPVIAVGLALLNFIPDLAFLIVIFFLAKYLLKLVKIFFEGIGKGLFIISGFDAEWAIPTYKIVRVLLIAFTVIVAYPYIPGSDSAAFKGVSLFVGVLFSLGSSSVVGNLIAGYSMTYRRTFKVGDLVKIDEHMGQVIESKLFATRLRTPKNEEIIVPNSIVLNTHVINYSTLAKTQGLILHTMVGIGYETPWRQVEGMLKLAAERTTGVLKEPPPFVHQKLLGDFAVNYELNVYCNDPINIMKHYTALHQNVLDVFNENNVQIMTPAYEGDPVEPKVVPKDQWFTPVAGTTKNLEDN